MAEFIQVMTTVDSRSAARTIAGAVVEKRLAACVQISECQSVYFWQGKIEDTGEYICVMKSRADLFPALEEALKKIHPYDVPEIIATEIVSGSSDYLDWLDHELPSTEPV